MFIHYHYLNKPPSVIFNKPSGGQTNKHCQFIPNKMRCIQISHRTRIVYFATIWTGIVSNVDLRMQSLYYKYLHKYGWDRTLFSNSHSQFISNARQLHTTPLIFELNRISSPTGLYKRLPSGNNNWHKINAANEATKVSELIIFVHYHPERSTWVKVYVWVFHFVRFGKYCLRLLVTTLERSESIKRAPNFEASEF